MVAVVLFVPANATSAVENAKQVRYARVVNASVHMAAQDQAARYHAGMSTSFLKTHAMAGAAEKARRAVVPRDRVRLPAAARVKHVCKRPHMT